MRPYVLSWLALVFLATAPQSARAQDALPDLSLEELLRMDSGRVFGASLRTQPATEAPSSVTFITADQIERFGYRSLADILRAVRSFYVTNDRNFSFLGSRGFGKPGDYNSRVLLLVNGHRVNDNIYGQAEIGPEFGMDPAMFERIEIIRGPGSALYGDSAFFAVVNVITKSGAALSSGSLTAEEGSLGTGLVRGNFGQQFQSGLDVVASGTYQDSHGMDRLYFPAFNSPETNNGVAVGLDGERLRQTYLSARFKGLTFTGAYGWRQRDVPTASFNTLFNEHDPREQTTDRHTLADLEYVRPFIGNGRITLRASYDRYTYDGIYPYAGDDPEGPVVVGHNMVFGDRWTIALRGTHALPAHQVVTAGTEIIDNVHQNQSATYSNFDAPLLDVARQSKQSAVYVDDQIKMTSWLIVNGGLRYDQYEQFTKTTPRVGVIFAGSSTQSLKYLYGRAFRAPNSYELTTVFFGDAVRSLRPEAVATHELVWERYLNDWLRTSVSGYRYNAENLITLVEDDSTFLGTTYVNSGHVVANGLELEAQMRLRHGIQAIGSYSLQHATDVDSSANLPNSPHHMFKFGASGPLPFHRATLAVQLLAMSPRQTLGGDVSASSTTTDVTFTMPLSRSLTLSGSAYNLFDVRYADPVYDIQRQDEILQNGRTFRVGLRVTLWHP
jgi:outer membrane receptor for ferrienterochelin and colicins